MQGVNPVPADADQRGDQRAEQHAETWQQLLGSAKAGIETKIDMVKPMPPAGRSRIARSRKRLAVDGTSQRAR